MKKSERIDKSCKSLFVSVKLKPKRIYYSSKILEFKNNAKETRGVMKELKAKIRNTESSLLKSLLLKKKRTYSNKRTAKEFNNFF